MERYSIKPDVIGDLNMESNDNGDWVNYHYVSSLLVMLIETHNCFNTKLKNLAEDQKSLTPEMRDLINKNYWDSEGV